MELRSLFISITAITFASMGFGLYLFYSPKFDVSVNSVYSQNSDITTKTFHLNKLQALKFQIKNLYLYKNEYNRFL